MKSTQTVKFAALIGLNLLLAFTAQSYPISPRPLRKLILESEFIVAVHVRDIRHLKSREGAAEAVLDITDVLQGVIKASTIYVKFPANLICPAPPRFEKNTDALVFLDKEDGEFSVHALSYGVKTLSVAETEVYRQRILEMQSIIKIHDKDQNFVETTAWLVKCAENPATRYEGSYELSRGSNFMSYYDREEKEPFEFTLTDDQKLRLKNALLNTPSTSYDDFGLVDLVYSRYTNDVFSYLVIRISQLNEDQLWYAEDYMNRINLYKSNSHTKELVKQFDDIQFDYQKTSEMKKIVSDFVKEIDRL